MKKILSLVLVVAMLLSVAPMTLAAGEGVGEATEPVHYRSLVMKDSIAINFKISKDWLDENGFTKAEFLMDGKVVQTITGISKVDSKLAVFPFTKLTPADMAKEVTVKYYAEDEFLTQATSSVLSYCNDVLGDANENALLKTALVDMLNYGAAAMTYNKQAVDADLAAALTTYASYATTTEPTLSSKTALTGDEGDVKWLTAGLNLKDSVTLRFKFSTPEVDGLTLKLTSNGQTWEITNFYPVEGEAGNYYAYFNGLNPAQLRQLVYGEFYAEGAAVSNKLTYSVESYAAADDGTDANLTALTKTLMTYGDSVYTWAYTYLAGSGLTYIEAEDVNLFTGKDTTLNSSVENVIVRVDDYAGSVNGSVIKYGTPGAHTTKTTYGDSYLVKPAHISFDVKASEAGTYYVWARVSHVLANSSGQTTSSSFSCIDGNNNGKTGWQYQGVGSVTEDINTFIWVKLATCTWEKGKTYSVRLRHRQADCVFDQFMVTTSTETPHDHVYSGEWSTDETNHWHACTTTGCTQVADLAAHDYGTTGVCACGKVDFYVGNSGLTYIEAEDVNLFTGMDSTLNTYVPNVVVMTEDGNAVKWGTNGAHKGKTEVGSTDLNSYPAHISFDVKAGSTGTYYVWARVCRLNSSASSFYYIDGNTAKSSGEVLNGWQYQGFSSTYDANGKTFVWVKLATCSWEEDGIYSVRFRHRQYGCIFDQFLVTSNSEFTPT